ncbi:MAG: putative toxin-antitoxin system toxin component, PIN family [Campylobacteraceae bacterium]|jgi:putative PIN family toxin of toxin-antitoxin system|nr:putative toxin-antitoxin system toxin component, PIN family [Campylobacteraceae bacterium]
MKCLLDTNILISAALFPNSVPAIAFAKAVISPYNAVICEYSIQEFKKVIDVKFAHKRKVFEKFVSEISMSIEFVPTPVSEYESEQKIRDKNDRPILRAAIFHKIDIIITGDKDFLEAGISNPKIVTPSQFLELY